MFSDRIQHLKKSHRTRGKRAHCIHFSDILQIKTSSFGADELILCRNIIINKVPLSVNLNNDNHTQRELYYTHTI